MVADSENIIQRLLGMFFSSNDLEVLKKRQLKAIAKELTKGRYKWYRPSSEEALPAMAKYFFEIYKVIGSAQVMLANATESVVLKNTVVELSLTSNQVRLKERLSDESIKERAKAIAPKELGAQVKDELAAFIAEFDAEKVRQLDDLYSQLLLFANFVAFDYFFMLKKFDSSLPERTFTYSPKFETIRGEYVLEDLKDFCAVAYALPLDADWAKIFSVVKAYREVDPVAQGPWNKLLNVLGDVRRSGVFDQIIRHLGKDPSYRSEVSLVNERIVDTYIAKLRTQTEMIVQQIQQENRNSKASELLKQIFGTDAIVRLKNYAERSNPAFERKMLGGYLYVEELNYLKAFLIDYFKRDVRALTDLFLVRGKWSFAAASVAYSGSFHELLELSDKITEFDESLAEDAEIGVKLRGMLTRADRDKEAVKQLRTQLKDLNDRALSFLSTGTQHLIVIARNLKSVLEDYEKAQHELITNWKELELNADRPIKEWVVAAYKQIYAFVMLMQLYLKGE